MSRVLQLSIVLCTYNGERYLQPQLDSLLTQSRLPDEVLICDDASRDSSERILQGFVTRCRKVGVVCRLSRSSETRGIVGNFSEGLRQATGDVVFLCDQDDVWHPGKLELMARHFDRDPLLLMLGSDARLVAESGEPLGCSAFGAIGLRDCELRDVQKGRAFEVLLRRSMIVGATAAIRRSAMIHALPVGEGWLHDEWLACVLAMLGRVDVISQSLIDYRQHATNQVGLRARAWGERFRGAFLSADQELQEELRRMDSLVSWLGASRAGIAPDRAIRVAEKQRHLRERLSLGHRSHFKRLPGILSELFGGRYSRFGSGVKTATKDFLRHA